MAKKVSIYHNPRCGKSREALKELDAKGIEVNVIEYLKNMPTEASLKAVCAQLGLRPEEMVRKGEELYKKEYKDKVLSDAAWLKVLVAHPILIERPIIIVGEKAVIARAPGVLSKFLKS